MTAATQDRFSGRTGLPPAIRAFLFLLLAYGAVCAYFAWAAPNFVSESNVFNILRQMSLIAIIAVGMTMVIIAAEIDLSVGSVAAFSGVFVAWLAVTQGLPIGLAIPITLVVGAAGGAFTAFLRVFFGIPSFITTLALLTGMRSAAFLLSGGFPISPLPPTYGPLYNGLVGPVPVPVIIMAAVYVVGYAIMSRTTWGRAIYAVGGNEEAARLSGINVGLIKASALMTVGVLAALAGVMLAARLSSGTPTVAEGWELDVIAAVIIGGTSLFGGAGSVVGTLLGALFMATLRTGMVSMGVPIFGQGAVSGAVIVLAVLLGALQIRRRR